MQHPRKLIRKIALASLPAALLLSWTPTASALVMVRPGLVLNIGSEECSDTDGIVNQGTLNVSDVCNNYGYTNHPGAVINLYQGRFGNFSEAANYGTINIVGGDLLAARPLTNAGLINFNSGILELWDNLDNQGIIKMGCGVGFTFRGGSLSGNRPVDVCPPSVTINQAAGQSDPTTSLPINFTVVFSEEVTGFAADDVLINGPAGAKATVTGSGKLYNVAVSGMTAFGTVFVDVKADAAQDAAGNRSTASTSTDKTVTYSKANTAPSADAGTDQSFQANKHGVLVTLNGSVTDADGDSLTYAWSFASKPSGSNATLADPGALTTTFTADLPGTYTLNLVANDGALSSAPDQVTITSNNLAPIAAAGDDQAVTTVGSTVALNASQSYDPNGDDISYQWSIVSAPADSTAALDNLQAQNPTFVVDKHGDYVVQLIVIDQYGLPGAADSLTVSFGNLEPVANAGINQSALIGATVNLDGSASADANQDALTYSWSLTSVPAGSTAQLSDPGAAKPSFTIDMAGTYQAQLIVSDGLADSAPSAVQVLAVSAQTQAIDDLQACQASIAGLPRTSFRNHELQKNLAKKLNAVIEEIDEGEYREALESLSSGLLNKVNGCATSETGAADKNDWITACPAQVSVYNCLQKGVTDLTGLANTACRKQH